MTYLNPITGAALPAAQAQQQLASDKARQVRRQQAAARNVAAAGDRFEHVVENADATAAVQHDRSRDQERRRRRAPAPDPQGPGSEEPPHVDVTG